MMEPCVICYENFTDQVIGIPEHCEHTFCFDCLTEWSKMNHSCPNDRIPFEFIHKQQSISSHKPYARVNITNTQVELQLIEVRILCDACDNDEQEYHPLLTCNQCRMNYHEFCLNSFNTSEWICPSCEHINVERLEPEPVNIPVVKAQSKTVRVTKPLRRLQRSTLPHTTGGLPTSNIPALSTAIQTREKHRNLSDRSVMTPNEAARRLAARGLPVVPSPRSAVLKSQAENMAALRLKRKLVTRLPSRIPTHELPRIPRRTNAPLRSQAKTVSRRLNPLVNASFIDKLLHSQSQLYSLKNIQIQGANVKFS